MADKITLTVPGALRYRALAVRVVSEAARLVSGSAQRDEQDLLADDVRDPFDVAVVSAFMEIFNNVAIHAYERDPTGHMEITITPGACELVIEISDHGRPFDPTLVPSLPTDWDAHSLPEGGMGLHIARTMLDDVTYEPGPPNRWRLTKRFSTATEPRAVRT